MFYAIPVLLIVSLPNCIYIPAPRVVASLRVWRRNDEGKYSADRFDWVSGLNEFMLFLSPRLLSSSTRLFSTVSPRFSNAVSPTMTARIQIAVNFSDLKDGDMYVPSLFSCSLAVPQRLCAPNDELIACVLRKEINFPSPESTGKILVSKASGKVYATSTKCVSPLSLIAEDSRD